jgi:hypothetical protein
LKILSIKSMISKVLPINVAYVANDRIVRTHGCN